MTEAPTPATPPIPEPPAAPATPEPPPVPDFQSLSPEDYAKAKTKLLREIDPRAADIRRRDAADLERLMAGYAARTATQSSVKG